MIEILALLTLPHFWSQMQEFGGLSRQYYILLACLLDRVLILNGWGKEMANANLIQLISLKQARSSYGWHK